VYHGTDFVATNSWSIERIQMYPRAALRLAVSAALGIIAILIALTLMGRDLVRGQVSASGQMTGSDPDAKKEAKPSFLVLPYLQMPTPTAMMVMWETNQKLPGVVEYGLTKELGHAVHNATPSVLHEVRLPGLKPGTRYHYRVRSGPLTSDIYSFKTAPPLGTRRWRMALYGDSRSNPIVHHQIAERIREANVDLILHTGDIVLNGTIHDSWRREFFEPLGDLARSVPWVSTIGNHERDSANYFSYMALPGNERYFGFDFANSHIVCLDSNGWIERGRDSKEFQWMSTHLREPRQAKWTFVAFHHPLFSAHATRPINSLRWDWAPLLLDRESGVDAVLTGHDHFYSRNYPMGRLGEDPPHGVLFLTSAGGGASLYRSKRRDYVSYEKSVHHFTLLDVDGDRITISAIDRAGRVFDRYELRKEPSAPEEFCAYEIEELKHFLRLAVQNSPEVPIGSTAPTPIDLVLHVPTRFRVPVSGQLKWQAEKGWEIHDKTGRFKLDPGQGLEIHLKATVDPGVIGGSPRLTLAFDPGKFRNRTIDLHPIKLAGPERIQIGPPIRTPRIDGKLDPGIWDRVTRHPLFAVPPHASEPASVQFLADNEWLYLGAKLHSPGEAEPQELGGLASPLLAEHLRLDIVEAEHVYSFRVPAHGSRHSRRNRNEVNGAQWQSASSREGNTWVVEMAIPRKLFGDASKLRINVVHHRRDGGVFVDRTLCPAYEMGPDPDQLPDWKTVAAREPFARISLGGAERGR
jgi:acid phosphatase type 7